jgi:single-strand DNA-binding protein
MKQLTIAGNIGKDAELRTTQGGDQVAGFSVAVESREGREKTSIWIDVSIWGKRAQALAPYLTKGARVCVSGDMGTREYNGKTYITLKADQVTLLGGGHRDGGGQREAGGGGHKPPAGGAGGFDDGDSIPFAPQVL